MSRVNIILIGIIAIAAIARLWLLGSVPNSLYWDEVSLGYNAFSISETLKDEHGHFMPILFEAFGDYKMPAYIYLTAIFVKIFGLNEFSVRIGSALMGIITVGLVYYLTKEILFYIKFNEQFDKKVSIVSLVAAFLLAISPWHLQFSRTGFEANGGLLFCVAGLYFFLRALRTNNKLLIVSALSFVISCYFYRSILLFTPFLLLLLFIVFFKDLISKKLRKYTLVSIFIFIALATPIFYESFFTKGSSRANDVLVFSNLDQKVSLFQMWAIQSGEGRIGNIVYNERFIYLNEIISNYLAHFSPSFLYTSGDPNPRHGPRNMGMEYIWGLPLLIAGVIVLAKSKGKGILILLGGLFIAPISAAVSIFAPHALRSLNMVPFLSIITAIGGVYLFYSFQSRLRVIISCFFVIVAGFVIFSYVFNYYKVSIFLSAAEWGDGYKQMNEYVKDHYDEYDKIIISGHYWEPYAYTLFYTRYSPQKYQENGNNYAYDKYLFGGTSWIQDGPPELGSVDLAKMTGYKKALVVLSPDEYAQQENPPGLLTEIKDINNKTVYFVGVVQRTEDK